MAGRPALAALALIAAAGRTGSIENYSCANPIAPCTACHSPEPTRELAKGLAEPWFAPASAKELTNPSPASATVLKFAKATYASTATAATGHPPATVKGRSQ